MSSSSRLAPSDQSTHLDELACLIEYALSQLGCSSDPLLLLSTERDLASLGFGRDDERLTARMARPEVGRHVVRLEDSRRDRMGWRKVFEVFVVACWVEREVLSKLGDGRDGWARDG